MPACSPDLIERGLAAFRRNAATRKAVGRVHDRALHAEIVDRRVRGNPTHVACCTRCRVYHPIHSDCHKHLVDAVADFREKHLGHGPVEVSSVPVWTADGCQSNADVKEAFQTEQTETTTNLQSLASSATAGWTGNSVDNTSNLYLDALVSVVIAAVNTAPGSDKCVYLFAFGGTNSSDLTTTGTSGGTVGTEGTLTFPSISTLPQLMPMFGRIPYPVQNRALNSGPLSVRRAFGGVLPPYHGTAILNFTGFTFAASGNTVKRRGLYNTVV